MQLLIQYFKKGFVVAARNLKCLLNKIKVVMFQLTINIPIVMPVMAYPNVFKVPRYSGARYNESAPNIFINVPFTTLKIKNQKIRSAWYFFT